MEQILIESDNLPLVQAVKSKTYIGEVESILRDIFLLAESLSNCGFIRVPREGNKVADGVAKCSLAGQLGENWRREPPREIAEQLRREASNQNGCSNRSHSMGKTQNTLHSRIPRQGNLNFGKSMWWRDLMPNFRTLNPLSVVNGADATSLERRNIFVNNANTPGQDSELGKEKFGVAEEPTGASLATKIHGRDAMVNGFTRGQMHQTTTMEISYYSKREGLGHSRTGGLRQWGGEKRCQRSLWDRRRADSGNGCAADGNQVSKSERDEEGAWVLHQ
ncbi:hypothetical protein AHAS_Ahas02G0214000 [Arachis hypogaea]